MDRRSRWDVGLAVFVWVLVLGALTLLLIR